jgi:hypothetical protein
MNNPNKDYHNPQTYQEIFQYICMESKKQADIYFELKKKEFDKYVEDKMKGVDKCCEGGPQWGHSWDCNKLD